MKTAKLEDFFVNKPIRIALIATYPEMANTLIALAKKQNVDIVNYYASFEEAVAVAKKCEGRVDGIISRGGTAAMIHENISSIPVVSVPISPFDLFLSIVRMTDRYKRFAFCNYARRLYGVQKIAEILDIEIEEYTFITSKDIMENVRDAREKGIPVFIGGNVAVMEAENCGVIGIEINSGEEGIYKALQEIVELVRVQRQEKAQTERLHMLFNEMSEGIIMTDENQRIVLTNPAARRMLRKSNIEAGRHLDTELSKEIRYDKAAQGRETVKDYIKQIGGSVLTISHFPVSNGGQRVGVVSTFEDVTKIQQLENTIRKKLYAGGFVAKHNFDDILTVNQGMRSIVSIAKVYAQSDSSIMLEGESGTGKELFAQSIHNGSKRKNGPFVAVNCSAIPESLLESELFGYEAGAFTGARKEGKPGLFELAHNGTLFFDEITEMPLHLQPRLLRIIQERQFMRLGGDKTISVNVRIICATNRNVRDMVEHNRFRGDLYYRLSVFELRIPPLRNRREDIIPCLMSFLSPEVLQQKKTNDLLARLKPSLLRHNWRGNVRELQSIAERISLFAESDIDVGESGFFFWGLFSDEGQTESQPSTALEIPVQKGLKEILDEYEVKVIQEMLRNCSGNQAEAARQLQISKATLWRKVSRRSDDE